MNPYEPPTVPDAQAEGEPPTQRRQQGDSLGPSLYGAGVRLIGLVLILHALYWGFYGFLRAAGLVVTEIEPFEYILATIAFGVVGVVMVCWAPVFVALAYRDHASREQDDVEQEL